VKTLARAAGRRGNSDILFAVRNFLLVLAFSAGAMLQPQALSAQDPAAAPAAQQTPSQNQAAPTPQTQAPPPAPTSSPAPAPQQAPPGQSKTPQVITPQTTPAPPPPPPGPVIVLDPAHGGTDSGARGENGIVEKDVALRIARSVRVELARQGFRVVMTRDDDSNPSYDARAAQVNAYRDAIFISLHVSSTGTVGTARAYYYQFANPYAPAGAAAGSGGGARPGAGPGGLLIWEEAQRAYAPASHRLADLIQGELAQGFANSPVTSTGVAIRELRSVAAPAVAIELSSVAAPDPNSLTAAAGPISNAIVQGLLAFRAGNQAGAR
jgi:N-acetylmuramoyl-L-alanine amidase